MQQLCDLWRQSTQKNQNVQGTNNDDVFILQTFLKVALNRAIIAPRLCNRKQLQR